MHEFVHEHLLISISWCCLRNCMVISMQGWPFVQSAEILAQMVLCGAGTQPGKWPALVPARLPSKPHSRAALLPAGRVFQQAMRRP